MTDSIISLCIGSIKAYRNGIYHAREKRRCIDAVDKRCVAVGVYTQGHIGVSFLYRPCDLDKIVKTVGRLSVSAENDLGITGRIAGKYRVDHLLYVGLALEPEAVRAVRSVTVVSYAEVASVGASVSHIDIKAVTDLVGYAA